ncbi:MAG: hypothetical protein R3E79_18680 [Caldilineaceae bacterium]
METVKSFLQAVALLLAIMLILYNTYTGVMIQEIGIPGFAMVKFGSQAKAEPSSSTAILSSA